MTGSGRETEGRGWKPDALWAFDRVRAYVEGQYARLTPDRTPTEEER